MQYELCFVVAGANVSDDAAVSVLADQLDAILSRAAGVELLTLLSEGTNAIDAARHAVVSCRVHVPELIFLRLDRDLVGIPEIAERTGRSRQNVTQWVTGKRHNDLTPFPAPEGTVGRARVWLWTEVNAWLRQLELDDGVAHPSRDDMTDIDYMLRHDRLRTLEGPPLLGGAWPYSQVRDSVLCWGDQASIVVGKALTPQSEPTTTTGAVDLLRVGR
ncbi:hypothetical protein AB0O34_02330 [Sphaerisporangium sp. NPDC088356]|uniref:helix-turn-helix transcriptional regulator n=1 Tax=Sphaerisporangium sp. NPDC088356 TaxID=3154871 RepID=UPI00342C4BD9